MPSDWKPEYRGVSMPKRVRDPRRIDFFREFLRHPLQIGSLVPSSAFLERRIIETAGIATARTIVELGPGTGGTTRAILRSMPQQARLLCIEINPRFHALVGGIKDDRLIAHLGSASDLGRILAEHGLEAPEAVISGIPFSTMSPRLGAAVIAAVEAALAPHGRFTAYQVSNCVAHLARPYLGREHSQMELRNIPPMRVFSWRKNGAHGEAIAAG